MILYAFLTFSSLISYLFGMPVEFTCSSIACFLDRVFLADNKVICLYPVCYLVCLHEILYMSGMQKVVRRMEFRQIPANSERIGDIISHLRDTFFADEPLNKSVKLCGPGEGHIELERHSIKTLRDGLSVMAVTDEDVVSAGRYF